MATALKWLRWLLRGALFLLLFGLAVKNSDPVVLRFFLGGEWVAPLAVALLVAFVAGVAVGLLAALGRSSRQRGLRRDSTAE